MSSLKHKVARLPQEPGVYKFYDAQQNLLYVGKSVSIKKRVASYFAKKDLGPKTNALVAKIADVKYIKVFSEFEALLLESDLIRTNQPFYNIQSKDDKSPLYIKITGSDVQLVETTRKQTEIKRGDFLKGPFQSAKNAKEILKLVRRIFPYCHHKNAKKPCLFAHLGLCPYPYASQAAKNDYKKTIKNIKKLLSGKSKELMRNLNKEMTAYSNLQKFEEAQQIKSQLLKLQGLTTTYHAPAEFLNQPTLVDDLAHIKLKELQKVLSLPKIPKRIECYDISNIQGKFATGSMVVFTAGRPDKHEYRRFKIKFLNTPNDYQMHKEVLSRRLKNNWREPDLIIIDGGRGQLTSAVEILTKYHKDIPVVALAKRLEEIYTTSQQEPLRLSKENPARQLAQALRDEAHRFAITYHRLLRSKQFLK